MGFYSLPLDELSDYTGKPVQDLKENSYKTLEQMIKDMREAKYRARNAANATDKEFARLVLKYFQPMSILRPWFDDDDIVLACADTGVTERTLCSEHFVEPDAKIGRWATAEYKETAMRSVPQYDAHGRELMERATKKVDVYRVSNQYQGNCHGAAILRLLYGRYPDLEPFNFKAYGMSCGEKNYEIYPDNHVYVSLAALLSGDIDYIYFRNREYSAIYNNGAYTPKECEKRLKSEPVLNMLRIIAKAGSLERAAGHAPFVEREDGRFTHPYGLQEIAKSADGTIVLLMEPSQNTDRGDKKYKLSVHATCPVPVAAMVNEFLRMASASRVSIHVYDAFDVACENGIHLEGLCDEAAKHQAFTDLLANEACRNSPASTVFGWKRSSAIDLTVRLEGLYGMPEGGPS